MSTSIIKKGEKYYFTSEDQVYELNEFTFARLKNGLVLPTDVYFRDCPFSFIGEIVSELFDESINIEAQRVGSSSDYLVSFTPVKDRSFK